MYFKKQSSQKYFIITVIFGVLAILNAGFIFWLIGHADFEGQLTVNDFSRHFETVKIGQVVINAELATTLPEQVQGLSGRKSLTLDGGMLFVFDHNDYWGIWMKDMLFPIDVLWISSALKITDVVQNMKPESYPTDYKPSVPVRYVLELPAGTIKNDGISVGQLVAIGG